MPPLWASSLVRGPLRFQDCMGAFGASWTVFLATALGDGYPSDI